MKAVILLIILLSTPIVFALEPFCGFSTFASCNFDSDCQKGGCSGQVCGRKGENTITTCEFKECYTAENYSLLCQCINNKCQWGYENRTPYSTTTTTVPSIVTTAKGIYNFLASFNPIFLIILGIILILVAKLARFIGIVLVIFALILLFLAFVR